MTVASLVPLIHSSNKVVIVANTPNRSSRYILKINKFLNSNRVEDPYIVVLLSRIGNPWDVIRLSICTFPLTRILYFIMITF